MSKKTLLSALVALSMGVSSNTFADFYVGLGFGNANMEFDAPNQDNASLDTETLNWDDSDTASKLFFGYRFSFVAAEIAYVDFGQIDNTVELLGQSIEAAEYGEVKGVSAFAMLMFGIGPADMFFKAGGFSWDSQLDQLVDAQTSDDDVSTEEDGFDLAYGIGAQVGLMGISVRAEYEYFNVDGDTAQDVSMVSVGATYAF